MVRRFAVLACVLGVVSTAAPASAVELTEAAAHVAVTVPDGWVASTDGIWSLAEAPDHVARVRITHYERTLPADAAAESYLLDLMAQSWSTYTVDRHARRVTCGRFSGVELFGHGSGESWDRAKFHAFLLVDPQSATPRGAVVLVDTQSDAWDAAHPALERAVHALH